MHCWSNELNFNIYQLIVCLFLICLNLTTILSESEYNNPISNETRSSTYFNCQAFNCEKLICSWNIPKSYEFKELQVFTGRTQKNCSNINGTKTDDFTFYECTWKISASICSRPRYEFVLKSRDRVKNVTITQNIFFNNFASVIPAPPTNFRVANRTSNAVLLKWDENINLFGFEPGLFYQIAYISDQSNQWTQTDIPERYLRDESSQKIHHYWLTNLRPYTEYKISMRLRSNEAKDDRFWSEYSTVTTHTNEDIPERPPKTVNGNFYVENNIKYRNITLYWKPLTIYEQNSDQVNYIFQIYRNNTWSDLVPNEIEDSCAKFCNLDFDEYIFRIYSQNRMGRSENYSFVQIPSTDSMIEPPSEFNLIFQSRKAYEIFWRMDNNPDIENYVIFWCKPRGISCSNSIDWMVVDGTSNSWIVNVDEENHYQFAISAQTANSSSGMFWDRCESVCSSKNCLQVGNVRASEIDLMWRFNCWREKIHAFHIFYCPVNKTGDTCDNLKEQIVFGDIYTHKATVLNLEPYRFYRIVVKINSGQQIGHPVYERTKEGEPTFPRNFDIFNVTNNSIAINWNSPINMNGLFGAYIIKYRKMQDTVWRHSFEISNITTTSVLLTNLSSNTEYNISLSACNALSKCSTLFIKEKTKIAVPGKIQTIIQLLEDTDFKNFTWREPEEIWNTTHKYEYRCEFIKNNKSSKFRKEGYVSDNALHLSIPTDICKDFEQANLTYIRWKVRGIAIDEMNNELKGEWSDEQRIFNIPVCEETSIILILNYFLILIIGVTAVTFGLVSLIRIVNKCLDIEVKLPDLLTMNQWIIDEEPEHSSFKRQYQDKPLLVSKRITISKQEIDAGSEELNSGRLEENIQENNRPYYSVNILQPMTLNVQAKIEFNSNIMHNLDGRIGNEVDVNNDEANHENLTQVTNTNNEYCQVNNLKPMTPNHMLSLSNIEVNENPIADHVNSENLAQESNTNNGYCQISNLKPMTPNHAISSNNIQVSAKENPIADQINSENLTQVCNENNGYYHVDDLKLKKPKTQESTKEHSTLNNNNCNQMCNNGFSNHTEPFNYELNSEKLTPINDINNSYCTLNVIKATTINAQPKLLENDMKSEISYVKYLPRDNHLLYTKESINS